MSKLSLKMKLGVGFGALLAIGVAVSVTSYISVRRLRDLSAFFHHDVEKASEYRGLVALVSLVDLLCRMSAVGCGYPEDRQVDFQQEPAVQVLLAECPELKQFDWERFTFEMEAYLVEVQRLVNLVYRRS